MEAMHIPNNWPPGQWPVHDVFMGAWDCAEDIEYVSKWFHYIDRFVNIVSGPTAPKLHPGEVRRFFDARRLRVLIIGTRFGNVVIFQEQHDRESVKEPDYRIHIPQELNQFRWYNGSRLNGHLMQFTVGEGNKPNIGILVENYFYGDDDQGN